MTGRCPTCGSVPRTVWTRAAILDSCQRWTDENGRAPFASDWRRATPLYPAAKSATDYFGTWNRMLLEAGLPPNREGGQPLWTRAGAVGALTPWVFTHGRLPKVLDWKKRGHGRPTAGQVIRLFGSWNAYLVAAGYEPARKCRPLVGYQHQAGMRMRQIEAAS